MAPFRFRLTRHLGAPASAEPAGQAGDWLQGNGDLLIAGMRGQVRSPSSSASWPTPTSTGWPVWAEAAGSDPCAGHGEHRWPGFAGDLADFAATPQRLAALQRDLLVPLELKALGGRADSSPGQAPSATCAATSPSQAPRTRDLRTRPRDGRTATLAALPMSSR